MPSPRINEETMKQYQKTLDFDMLFNLTLQQVEILFEIMKREKEKKLGGKTYSAYSLKKARLISLNVQDLLHMFRMKSIGWEKERKKEKDGTRKSQNSSPKE